MVVSLGWSWSGTTIKLDLRHRRTVRPVRCAATHWKSSRPVHDRPDEAQLKGAAVRLPDQARRRRAGLRVGADALRRTTAGCAASDSADSAAATRRKRSAEDRARRCRSARQRRSRSICDQHRRRAPQAPRHRAARYKPGEGRADRSGLRDRAKRTDRRQHLDQQGDRHNEAGGVPAIRACGRCFSLLPSYHATCRRGNGATASQPQVALNRSFRKVPEF